MTIVIVLSCALAGLIILFFWWYFGGSTGELKKAKKEFDIPGLDSGFVPQGITYLSCYKKFLLSGYMQDHSPSRVYVVDKESGKTEKYITLKLASGKMYSGHAGGIASNCNDCYISSEGKIFHFFASDIFGNNYNIVSIDDFFETKNGADFCFISDKTLYVGEFYKLAKFKTDVSHHIKADEKKFNHSIVFGYDLKENGRCGLKEIVPKVAISIPDIVQGIAIQNNKILVSRSYGVSRSELLEYENVLKQKTQNNIYFDEKQVPLYVLSDKNLRKTRFLPEMSEEIEIVDGKIFIVFESGSKKYKLITRTRIGSVFSLDLD